MPNPIGIPPRESVSAEEYQKATSTNWLLWGFAILAVIMVLWWLFFDSAVLSIKGWLGRRHLDEMRLYLKVDDYNNAARTLNDATRWAPNDPEVLRAAVEFVEKTGAEPRLMIRFLSKLDEDGDITDEELSKLGRMQVLLPDLKEARTILDRFQRDKERQRPALELLSAIQKAEGLHARSFLTQRQALLADPDDPDSVLKLALLDASSGDPSLSGPGRERLWPIARKGGEQALPAVEHLASHQRLTAEESLDLMVLADSLPDQDSVKTQTLRFAVLSAVLRLHPHQRQDRINEELRRWNGRAPAILPPLIQWLNAEQEYERVLRLISAKTASTYSSLLPHYVLALRGERKWIELKVLVSSRIDPSFSRAQLRLWLAEAESHLSSDPTTARHHITTVFDESGRGEQLQVAVKAGELAEQLGYYDIARQCYEGAAARHLNAAVPMQSKVYDMAAKELNGAAMLRASERLRELRQTDIVFLDRMNYLRLLLGSDLELALQTLDSAQNIPAHHITEDRRIALSLLRALAAFRTGHNDEIKGHLDQVRQMDTFPPGPRAVYAGLLDIIGRHSEAYAIAENIHASILLPEEQRFFMRARFSQPKT